MFNGIIEDSVSIVKRELGEFTVENPFGDSIALGESISHDGACMTISKISEDYKYYSFFMVEESLAVTHFADKNIGYHCNVERGMKFDGRIDGHLVTGHIDCVGKLIFFEQKKDNSRVYKFEIDESKYCIRKGSICINGVSLTIVDIVDSVIEVSIIPYTYFHTNFCSLSLGQKVNIEYDMMTKYIVRTVSSF